MSIIKFFVRAIAVVPEELTRYISQSKDTKSSITPNRGAVCTSKVPVKLSGDIILESPEAKKVVTKAPVIDDGPII